MKVSAPFTLDELRLLRRHTSRLPVCPNAEDTAHAHHMSFRRRGEFAVTSDGLICHTCGHTIRTVTIQEGQ